LKMWWHHGSWFIVTTSRLNSKNFWIRFSSNRLRSGDTWFIVFLGRLALLYCAFTCVRFLRQLVWNWRCVFFRTICLRLCAINRLSNNLWLSILKFFICLNLRFRLLSIWKKVNLSLWRFYSSTRLTRRF
jgi:hypothetical protein